MRFLIIDGEYPEFVERLYSRNRFLRNRSYEEQLRFRNERLYGMADYYSSNLKKLGHEAHDVWVNNEILQRTWAREHGFHPPPSWRWNFRLRRRIVPWATRVPDSSWMFRTLAAQIGHYKPDVLVNMMITFIPASFLREIQQHTGLIVTWGSPRIFTYPFDPTEYRGLKHVIATNSRTVLDYLKPSGLDTELIRHAFEPRVLSTIEPSRDKPIPISFIGLLRGIYGMRRKNLEFLCAQFKDEMQVFVASLEDVDAASPIRGCRRGEAWGEDLYRVLARSKIAWNIHHELAGDSADNLRLFEATGMGALLVTDWKKDLGTVFDVGKEVVAYKSIEECAELIRYYLDHPRERDAIAAAGQKRTLQQHTYWHRARQLAEVAKQRLA